MPTGIDALPPEADGGAVGVLYVGRITRSERVALPGAAPDDSVEPVLADVELPGAVAALAA